MTPILFYGVPEGCSFGSIVAFEWSGLPYRLCRIPMPDVVSSPAYRPVNAVGETPTLRTDDGRLVSESLAVLLHLGHRVTERGLAFAPGTPDYDRLNRMLAFLNTSFFNAFAPLWHALEHGAQGEEDRVLKAYGRASVEKAHANLERLLDGQPWLLGTQRTLADAYFAGIARWADFHQAVDRRRFPGLARLHDRLQDDPAVQFAHDVEEERPARSTGRFEGHVTLEEALR